MARLIVYLLPQAIPVGVPMGLVVGVLCGMRGRVVTTRVRRTIAALAVACSIAMLVDVAWVMPAGNQAFRELMFGGRLLRGTNELTLGELASRDTFQFHFRLALAFAPLVLGLFALGVSRASRGAYGSIAAGLMALAICFAYYVLLWGSRSPGPKGWQPAAAGWAPDLVFGLAAVVLLRRRGMEGRDVHERGPAAG
jgi:lipopolysaccharide export LptBFGC system permease protein LptF